MQLPNIKAGLSSNGRSNGTPYTKAERNLAVVISMVVLTATGHKDFSEQISEEDEAITAVSAAAEEKGSDNLDVPGLCRAAYRKVEATRLEDDSTATDFPKQKDGERVARDFTSVNLLFRKAFIDGCGFSKAEVEPVFKSYSSNKKKAG